MGKGSRLGYIVATGTCVHHKYAILPVPAHSYTRPRATDPSSATSVPRVPRWTVDKGRIAGVWEAKGKMGKRGEEEAER